MPRLGAHMSIAGGLPYAVDRATAVDCDALQIFTKSANQWKSRPLPDEELHKFKQKISSSGIHPVVAHGSYLINVATPDQKLRTKSIEALGEELDRVEALNLLGLVMHPGSYTTGTEEDGLNRIADALNEILAARPEHQAMLLLEHTAGQGTNLGHRFEQLSTIIDQLEELSRIGICLDTCHLFASGYDISSERGYERTFADFDAVLGLDRLKVFHLNDSKKPCGSRVDRHEHIGQGCLGLDPFRRLLQDRRFSDLPMLLETPKEAPRQPKTISADSFDLMNLQTLRKLA